MVLGWKTTAICKLLGNPPACGLRRTLAQADFELQANLMAIGSLVITPLWSVNQLNHGGPWEMLEYVYLSICCLGKQFTQCHKSHVSMVSHPSAINLTTWQQSVRDP